MHRLITSIADPYCPNRRASSRRSEARLRGSIRRLRAAPITHCRATCELGLLPEGGLTMPALVTIVPFIALAQDCAAWASWLWLVLLLPPLIALVLGRTGRRRRAAAVRRTRRPCRRALFRWPTRFPVALLVMGGHRPAGGQAGLAAEGSPTPAEPRRLSGMVLDISGGGLRVRVDQPVLAGTWLRVDPEFAGPFPLAGVQCRVLSSRQEAAQTYLQLCFVRLPADTEARIIRRIYQRQLGFRLGNPMDPDRRHLRRRRGLYGSKRIPSG